MVLHKNVLYDSRVKKEARSLAKHGYAVTVVSLELGNKPLDKQQTYDGFQIIGIKPSIMRQAFPGTIGKLLRLAVSLPQIRSALRKASPSIYHAHDFVGLLLLAFAGVLRTNKVIYDAHELFFDRWSSDTKYTLKHVIQSFRPIEKRLAKHVDHVITVSNGLAEHLERNLQVERPTLILNAVDIREETNCEVDFAIPNPQLTVVHTGNLVQGRNLFSLVAAFQHVSDDINLVLLGDGYLKADLLTHAESLDIADSVHFIPPVASENVYGTIQQADIAAVMMGDDQSRLNYYYGMPNKLFEAIAGGLPIVSSSSPEIARVVTSYDLGIACDPTDPQSIGNAIQKILEPETYKRCKQNVMKARKQLNWEQEEKKLLHLYKKLGLYSHD